jgi:DNA-directed RNA polymerase specialized sigma subunit
VLFLRFELDLVQSQIAAAVGRSQMHVSRILAASLEALRTQAVAA